MKKKTLTQEQIYKRNQRKAKALKVISPIVRWGFVAIAIVCFVFAIKNSFGNIAEIIDLLNDKVYTGEQLSENYAMLIQKYGEWQIGTGGSGFAIMFINIKNAVFSGIMITNCIVGVICLVSSLVLGKWFLPYMAKHIEQENQDMVNIKILKE